MRKIKALFNKLPDRMQERILIALLLIFFPIIAYALLGIIFGSIIYLFNTNGSYINNIYVGVVGSYIYLGGTCFAIYGLILIANPNTNLPFGFVPGLFYGTIIIASFLRKFITTSESNLYFLSFLIVALICYIIWLEVFKPKYKHEEIAAIVIPCVIIFLICLFVLPEDDPVECYRCGDYIHPEYTVTDFEQDYVCPSCINKQIEKIRSGDYKFCIACNEYLEQSYLNEYGLCEYCADKYICECAVCGETGVCISNYPEYFLCEGCTHKAIYVLESLEDADK